MAIFDKKPETFFNRIYWSSLNNLSFERFWSLLKDWFDPPNETHGGWSDFTRIELDTRKGKTAVFFKRQQNYFSRTWRQLIRGVLTFQKKLENIQQLNKTEDPDHTATVFWQARRQSIVKR